MASITLRGITCPDTVLVPQRHSDLILALRKVVPQRMHARMIDESIEKSMRSIGHKLTVAMYQAALLCSADMEDYVVFRQIDLGVVQMAHSSVAQYKGTSHRIENKSEFDTFLTFFIETFAATCFSLLDVCGQLLHELYKPTMPTRKNGQPVDVNFYNVLTAIRNSISTRPHPIIAWLEQGDLASTNCFPWLKTLKEMRNRTTHRSVMDICKYVVQGSPYASHSPAQLLVGTDLLPPNAPDTTLSQFAVDVFDACENFVEGLYDLLTQAIVSKGQLPIT
jgi:hypothetical protein